MVDLGRTGESGLAELRDLIGEYPGDCITFLHLRDFEANTETVISLDETFKVKAGSELRRRVNGALGYPAVETLCGQFHRRESGNRSNRPYRRSQGS